MGGEGSMLAAINSLKNNRSLLSKRKERSALGGSYSNVKLAKFPKATPEQLKEIRNRTIKENRKTRTKIMLCFVLFLVLTSIFLYLI
ncbi:hypothetical protein [Flavivirga rizhaonensis]|uniref:Uncharacterized protein n=1 Tax=Flavivirga rizhaonensis TaxID=2559571 RepID=A0A4S1DYH8_9FLAO|nr:hypothetical protein [Flavivirga rizhaonensis]TGV03169.1 hypothetical protein EM932_07610 [Flavivirga rizhaonensis]